MARGLVVHIEVGQDSHTEVLTHERIRIGSCEDCDLRLRLSDIPLTDGRMLLELARTNGHYRVADFDPSLTITHNGEPLASGTEIADGDKILVGQNDLALQFFPIRSLPAPPAINRRPETTIAPFIEQAAVEAAATRRRDDAKVFLREFTRELLREINTSTKITTLVIAIALVGGILYLGFAANKELQRSRNLINEQNKQLERMKEEVDGANKQLKAVVESNDNVLLSMSLAPRLWKNYSNGVCLIAGTYIFVEPGTNRPLRYPEQKPATDTEAPAPGKTDESPPQPYALTPEGNGPIAQFDFVGTGFHVGDGYILTNRHVAAQPWVADERAQSLSGSTSAKPRMTRLLAFFPGHTQPFALRFKETSQRDDLAVCTLDTPQVPTDIPALPLDHNSDAAAIGKAVVMMGYPSGPERILASLPEDESRSIQQRYGSSLEGLLGQLAERGLIKPLTTQGHITDLDAHRIVYDARTAEGGSGAPLFGQSGRVIAVNFAVFTGLQDSNFAVPINFAAALLQRAGWKLKEQPAETPSAVNTGQKETRSVPSTN